MMTGLSKLNPKVSDSSDDVSTESISSESIESTDPGSMESEDPDMENYDEMLRNVEKVLRIGAPDDDDVEEEELDEDILKEMCNFLMEQPDKSFKDLMEEEEAKVVELEDSDDVEEDSEDPEDPLNDSDDVKNPEGATMDPEVVVAKSELQKDSEDLKDIEYWNMLPMELKMDVIGRLDLFSRHAMRGTCSQNRSIVDSKEFFVPRVKFARTQSKHSIMIFMGVEKWVEFRVQQDKQKRTIVSRFENTLDPQRATSYVSSLGVSEWVVAMMVGVFSHDSILIGTLEWAIFTDSKSNENFKNRKELHDKLQMQVTGSFMNSFNEYSGKTAIFRVKKSLAFGESSLNVALSVIFDERDLLGFENLCGHLVENPVCVADQYNPKSALRGLSQSCSRRFEGMPSLHHYLVGASKLKGISHLKFAKLDDESIALWNSINAKIQSVGDFRIKYESKLVKSENVLLLVRHTMSPCGYWITVIPTNDAERMGGDFVRSLLSENKCRMGALCQKCSDPFDYWYHKNFVDWQRAVEDPTVPQPPTVTRKPTVPPDVLNEVNEVLGQVSELSKTFKRAYQDVDQILEQAQENPLVYRNPEMVESVQTCRQFSDQIKQMVGAAETALSRAQKVFGAEGVESEGPEGPEEPEGYPEPQMFELEEERKPEESKPEPQKVFGPEGAESEEPEKPEEVPEPKAIELEEEPEEPKEVPKPKDQDIFEKMGRQLFEPDSEAARTTVFEDWDEKEENLDATVDFVEPEPVQFVEFMKRRRQHEIDQTEGNFERWIGLAIGMTLFFSALFILFHICLWINSFF